MRVQHYRGRSWKSPECHSPEFAILARGSHIVRFCRPRHNEGATGESLKRISEFRPPSPD
jgi:hypothetical protein